MAVNIKSTHIPKMKDTRRILAIVPARGGSKQLPGKNIMPLDGKPLIAYTIEAALKSRFLKRVIVSTEDYGIARLSRGYGAEIPFMRPKSLAGDKTPTAKVIAHLLLALKRLEGYAPDVIVLLQPTSPLRSTRDIDAAVELFLKSGGDSVISVVEAAHPLELQFVKDGQGLLTRVTSKKPLPKRRQDLRRTLTPNGAIFVISPKTFLKHKSFYAKMNVPYEMPRERSIDIDTKLDFDIAEFLIKRR
jgi:CMP-N,N'-diacetyllegionaminic acid synthase